MANDVVTQGALTGLGQRNRGFEGLEGFSSRDLGIQPPSLRIVQKKKRGEKGDVGDLRLGGEDPVQSIDVIILGARNQRFLYEGPQGSARLTCMSGDGQQPLKELLNPKSPTCPDCDYAQWTDDPEKKGKGGQPKRVPPECSPAIVFLGLRPATEEKPALPFWLVCSKSAFKAAQEFAAEIQKPKHGLRAFRQALVRISTSEVSNAQGAVYYVPQFTVVEKHDEWYAQYREIFLATNELVYAPDVAAQAAAEDDEDTAAERATNVTPGQQAGDGVPF